MAHNASETKARSIVKTITWRVIATITTMILVFVATRELTLSISVGLVEVVTKLILYYLHERGWNATKWGKIDQIEQEGVQVQQESIEMAATVPVRNE